MFNTYSLFDDFFSYNRRPSIYVVSDSQLAEWKREQARKEIEQLDRLIDGHKTSIERLEATKAALTPAASQSESPQSLPQESETL